MCKHCEEYKEWLDSLKEEQRKKEEAQRILEALATLIKDKK